MAKIGLPPASQDVIALNRISKLRRSNSGIVLVHEVVEISTALSVKFDLSRGGGSDGRPRLREEIARLVAPGAIRIGLKAPLAERDGATHRTVFLQLPWSRASAVPEALKLAG